MIRNKHPHLLGTSLLLFLLFALPLLAGATTSTVLVEKLRDFPATLQCENLEVPTLLRAIGRQSGINIYVSDEIKDTISFEMNNVSLYDVFELIIEAKNLHYSEIKSAIFVETEEAFNKARKGMVTERICTDYGNSAKLKEQLDHLLSDQGVITATNNDSCLLVKDQQRNVADIKEMLAQIDRPIPQIHIEARVVVVSKEGREQLGIKWGYQNYGNSVIMATKDKPVSIVSDLGIAAATTAMNIGFIWDNMNLNIDLQAMAEDNLLHVLSTPSLLVLDGHEAEIKQGKEVPYTSQSGDIINTEFREANLSLKVTPKIIKNSFVNLDVNVTNDSIDQTNAVGGEPLINRQEITTNLFLEDKVTVVIGGIHVSGDDLNKGRVPGLSSLPILGNLFKNKERLLENYELMIFLTPTIVSMDELSIRAKKRNELVEETLSKDVHKEFLPETFKQQEEKD
jgi:type IV pilus secretin PilQ/predicted competence protein